MTVWENGKKTKLRKYFLTMFLRDRHFKHSLKLILSLRLNLKSQTDIIRPMQMPMQMFLKFQALGIDHRDFYKKALCDTSSNSRN